MDRLPNRQQGITLIELMIVVAIVAILAAIAYPSYQSQVRKSRRAAAQSFLMDAAGREQQRLLDVRAYSSSLADLNLSIPNEIAGHYTLNITVGSAPPSFTLTATAVGAQANDSSCSALTLTNTGAKSPAGCW
jgi:type IV pilus assembly protein PilE